MTCFIRLSFSRIPLFKFVTLDLPVRCHIHCRWRWWRWPRRLLCWKDWPPDWTSSPGGPRCRPRPPGSEPSRRTGPAAGAWAEDTGRRGRHGMKDGYCAGRSLSQNITLPYHDNNLEKYQRGKLYFFPGMFLNRGWFLFFICFCRKKSRVKQMIFE